MASRFGEQFLDDDDDGASDPLPMVGDQPNSLCY
jgi:hypothetical protein